jgi:hypothetical protein
MSSIKTHIHKHDNPARYLPAYKASPTNYEVKTCSIENVEALPFLMQFEEPHELYIPVYNNTLEDIVIEADTKIAEIEIYSTDVDVCRMAVGELDEQHASIHECNNARPDFINNDDGMDEEEKEEAFMHYLKRGYHHPSMTKEVESKASLTEIYIKSTVQCAMKTSMTN